MLRSTVISILMVAMATSVSAKYLLDKPGCNDRTVAKVDRTMALLTSTGPSGRKMPENAEQLQTYCNETSRHVSYVESFIRRCYTPDIRDFSKVMIYSVKNSIKQFCRKRSKKLTRLMEIAPCINKIRNSNKCMNLFIERVRNLQYLENDKLKIPHACCRFVETTNCIETTLEKYPCAQKRLPEIMDFLRGLYGNLVNFACGEYVDSSNKCELLGPPPPTKVKSTKRYKTFMFALLDLLESMGKTSAVPGF